MLKAECLRLFAFRGGRRREDFLADQSTGVDLCFGAFNSIDTIDWNDCPVSKSVLSVLCVQYYP
jgi:hypothetical protein